MRLFQPDSRQRRTLGALFAISLVIAVLLTAFYNTQVVRGESYAVASEDNRLRPVVIPAPRGTIYDRYGEVVATSIPGFSVVLLPGSEETILETLADLQPFLGLADTDIDRIMERRAASPHGLLTITEDATFSQIAALEERRASFPNLLIIDRPKRHYPAGPALAHIIGYVSEITREELQLPIYQEAGYRQGRWIGKNGIEKQYELRLSGEDGARFVEVDAKGRIVNPRSTVEVQPPQPGQDLQLTLDLELQKYVEEIFPDTMKGSVVAMVPSTGEILAMYSNPSFDPNDFVGGISTRLWRALQNDPLKPLIDRAMVARYPPASTFKLATAVEGVRRGLVTAETRMPVACSGGLSYAGRYWRCWNSGGHGSLGLAAAIEKSCNVYFYQLGLQIGLQEFIDAGTRMGFADRTGIDLPNEARPIFPESLDWYENRFGYRPKSSEVLSLSIGQGPNTQTVLRTAHFYSALAGDGTAPPPHLVAGEIGDEGAIDLGLTPEQLEEVWVGLAQVVRPGGTAVLSSLANWHIYGKTGTAQNPPNPDHGWFVGFSGKPGGSPEIVVAAIIEHGLHGSDVSPMAAKVINHYLSRKHGMEVDPQPTYIERLESGRARGPDSYPEPLHAGVPQASMAAATTNDAPSEE